MDQFIELVEKQIKECKELRHDFWDYEPQYKALTYTIASLNRELLKYKERKKHCETN